MKSEVVVVKGGFKKLNDFLKSIAPEASIKIGIMGDKNARQDQGMTNARLGAIQELGWPPSNIPPRSFLRMPLMHESERIIEDASVGMLELLAHGQIAKVLDNIGIACENAIQRAFESRGFGNWRPDKPRTIQRKHSDAPLIDTAQLRRSIDHQVEGV